MTQRMKWRTVLLIASSVMPVFYFKILVNYMDKQKVISYIYYDKSGYGSKAITLKDARQKDKAITANDVNEFFKKNVEEKRKQRGQNSFVAPHSFWEFQLDLFFIPKNDLENQKFRIGTY